MIPLSVEYILRRRLRSVWRAREYLNVLFTCTLLEPRYGHPWHHPYLLCHCFSSFSLFHIFSSCLLSFRPVSTTTVVAHFHLILLPFQFPVIFVLFTFFHCNFVSRSWFVSFLPLFCVSIFSLISAYNNVSL